MPLAWHIPPHTVPLPVHWVLSQQFAMGMQVVPLAVLHVLNVEAHVVHRPAPVHVKFPPHGAAAGGTQVPPLQVPAPTRFAPEHVGRLQPLVVG